MNIKMKYAYFSNKEGFFLLLTSLLLVWAVGFRPSSVGSDTLGYVLFYQSHSKGMECLFQFIVSLVGKLSLPVGAFFSFIAFVDFLLLLFLARKLVALNYHRMELNYLLLLLGTCLFVSPFFFASMVNVLRQGSAIFALFIFYVVLISRSNILSLILPLIGFHHTAIIAIVFSPLVFLGYRVLFYSVLVADFFYLSGLSEKLIKLISILSPIDIYSQISNYGEGALSGYHIGRRLDFTLFTLLAGMAFNFMANRFLLVSQKTVFSELLKIYWVFALPFTLFGFGAYSDRYLLPAWLFLSVLGAVFMSFVLKNRRIYMPWLYCVFAMSAIYFVLRAQGILVFKLR